MCTSARQQTERHGFFFLVSVCTINDLTSNRCQQKMDAENKRVKRSLMQIVNTALYVRG